MVREMREHAACGDRRGPGTCRVRGGCPVDVGGWCLSAFALAVSLCFRALAGSFASMDRFLRIAKFSPYWSLCYFSLFIAIYSLLNLEPSVKWNSGLFTLFSQIINEDKTFNGIEFCSRFLSSMETRSSSRCFVCIPRPQWIPKCR